MEEPIVVVVGVNEVLKGGADDTGGITDITVVSQHVTVDNDVDNDDGGGNPVGNEVVCG